jgi:hypothetical protein
MSLCVTGLLVRCTLYIVGYANCIQNGSHDCCGSTKALGLKVKPASWVRAAQSNQSEGRSNTKGGYQLAHPELHRGALTSSSFISESQLGGFIHAPLCGLAPGRLGFPARDYTGKCLKPPGPDLAKGGISLCLVLWRGTCPGWLPPVNGDPSSTQIMTQHYGVWSQTVSQLESSGTMPTSTSS